MKKTILLLVSAFCLLLVTAAAWIVFSGPYFKAETDKIITTAIENGPVDLLKGTAAVVDNHGVHIWYESFSPPRTLKGTIILVMGIVSDAMVWPRHFIEPLVKAGYRVVRFDHRGLGLSDWVTDWSVSNYYTLWDMAEDAVAVLDDLGIEKAHVVGVSMGGMIAQCMAVNYPERLLSLTSIMSTGDLNDPNLPSGSKLLGLNLMKIMIKYGLMPTEENIIRMQFAARTYLRGNALTDSEAKEMCSNTLYNLRARKGYNYKAGFQHYMAILRSGARYEALKKITLPTLIIHGKADPLVPFSHGEKCARLIPNAKTLWVEGMGHDLEKKHTPQITERIIAMVSKNS